MIVRKWKKWSAWAFWWNENLSIFGLCHFWKNDNQNRHLCAHYALFHSADRPFFDGEAWIWPRKASWLSSRWPKYFGKKRDENKRFSKMKLEMKKTNLMAFWFWFHFSRGFVLCHGFLVNCQKSQFFRQVGFPPMGYIQVSLPR